MWYISKIDLNYDHASISYIFLIAYEKLYTKDKEQFLLSLKMSDYYDIKKLCVLSRLEIDDSEIQQTDDKIKEIITFFNKLDEFEINEKNSNNQDIVNAYASDNYLKLEKKMIDLRDDLPIKKIDSNFGIKEDISFNFKFHDKRNGYVIGPGM